MALASISLYKVGIPAAVAVAAFLGWFMVTAGKRERLQLRIARATKRRSVVMIKSSDALSLRKAKGSGIPFIGQALQNFAPMNAVRAKLERAGLAVTPDVFVTGCGLGALFLAAGLIITHKPPMLALAAALMVGLVIPNYVINFLGARRIRRFLALFPDAIDFIVRGLRSGLPVTESMNMVGNEMSDPIGPIFASVGESVRLGVSVEKALTDTARKLKSTEFNFFVTSIILQRETGGNLSEILNNLSDVLRKRFMMKMKIKAMSSEAKASASIVGSLPFFVVGALWFVSPGYLDPLLYDDRGHEAAIGALVSLFTGIGIMMKMAKFEI